MKLESQKRGTYRENSDVRGVPRKGQTRWGMGGHRRGQDALGGAFGHLSGLLYLPEGLTSPGVKPDRVGIITCPMCKGTGIDPDNGYCLYCEGQRECRCRNCFGKGDPPAGMKCPDCGRRA